MAEVHETPSDVSATEGVVTVTGPGGVVYSMSPQAAADTSDRLLESACQAQGQLVEAARLLEEERAQRLS